MEYPAKEDKKTNAFDILKTICKFSVKDEIQNADYLMEYDIDWNAVWDIAENECVTYWCMDFISRNTNTIKPDRMRKWQDLYIDKILFNQLALSQLAYITKTLAAENIEIIALKGSALLLWLYDDIGARGMTDIDIMIDEKDMMRAIDILCKNGYTIDLSTYRIRSLDMIFTVVKKIGGHMPHLEKEKGFTLEPHLNFLYGCGDWDTIKHEISTKKITVSHDNTPINCLCPNHAFIHAAIHYLRHIDLAEQHYRWIFDMALMIKKNTIEWDDFWITAKKWTLDGHMKKMLEMLHQDFDLPVSIPETISLNAEVWDDLTELGKLKYFPTITMKAKFLRDMIFPSAKYIRKKTNTPNAKGLELTYLYFKLMINSVKDHILRNQHMR